MGTTTLLFDLDGTLTDSQAGIIASFTYALTVYDLKAGPDAIRAQIGPPLFQGFRALGVPEAQLHEAVATYREYFATKGIFDNRVYAGIPEVLQKLHDDGHTLALATSKLQEYGETILEHFALRDLFTVVAGATRDGARLYKAEVIEHALGELGASQGTMIGDRRDDMEGARAHGLRAVGVLWGYGSAGELEAAGAERLLESPEELLTI